MGRFPPKAAFQTTPADATLGPLLLEGLEVFDGHEHGPGLGTLRRPDHTLSLQQIHDAPGPGEPHPELALKHARRAEPAADDELHRRVEELGSLLRVAPAP